MYYFAYVLLYSMVFMIGACLGSFFYVVALRLPAQVSFVQGRSHCPHCQKNIPAYDLVPVFSFLWLRGKCRNCKEKIGFRYFLAELLMGLWSCFLFHQFGFGWGWLLVLLMSGILFAISLIDWHTMTIPNGLVLALAVFVVLAVWLGGSGQATWIARLLGLFAVSLPMGLLMWLIPGSFGGGDLKLMVVCGFWLGWQQALLAGFFALLAGGAYGAWLLWGKKQRGGHMPFGPFLAGGVLLALLYGQPLLHWYIGFLH